MANGLDKIDVAVVERLAPRSGPTSSANFNATLQEIINSFAQVSNVWNNNLQPLIDSLPTGSTVIPRESRSSDPNPFDNGFDGSQVYLDMTSDELTEEGKYFDIDLNRPVTIKEALINLESKLTQDIQDVLIELARVSQTSGITTRQKQSIGARIFDPEQTSSSNSLDGLVQTLIRYTNQLELDIAADSAYLTGEGVQTLDFSILAQLAAIQAGHDYDPVFNTITHDDLDIHTHKFHITPVGSLNGINKEFFLPGTEEFVPGSLQIFENGLQLRKTYSYSEKANQRGFDLTAFHTAPFNDGSPSSDWVWMHYILKED